MPEEELGEKTCYNCDFYHICRVQELFHTALSAWSICASGNARRKSVILSIVAAHCDHHQDIKDP